MKKATVRKGASEFIENTDVTSGFWERFIGLMFRKSIPDSYGLLIKPCNQIHMFNMRFPLDVIYLSKDGTVVHIDENIKPWKVGRTVREAESVIEVNAGICAKKNIKAGDHLIVEKHK